MKKRFSLRLLRAAALGVWVMCAMATAVTAQGRKVTLSKLTVTENATKFGSSLSGIELRFDLAFNWRETEFMHKSFKPSFRLVQGGQTVLKSSDMADGPSSLFATDGTVGGKPGMMATSYKIFIPYMEIPLESGPQKADFILTLTNDEGTYTDCAQANVNWKHRKMVRHSINEQEFTLDKITVNDYVQEFSTNKPGMQVMADVGLKYGADESADEGYTLGMLIRSGGKVVYDSRTSQSSSDKTRYLRIEALEGKPLGKIGFHVNYEDLGIEGNVPAEMALVLLGAEGGPKEVAQKAFTLNAPVKYRYAEQEFNLKKLEVNPAVRDGVQGISVHYACGFKHTTMLRDPERGKYYFYLALFDASGKLAIDPARAPKSGYGTSHLMDGQLPSPAQPDGEGSLFIPMYMLTVPAGTASLKYALMVSDANLGAKFPVVGQGSLTIQKPAERRFRLSLERLEMIDANYDAEFIPPGSHLPELQYLFCVGDDAYYSSDYNKNSLIAIPGEVVVRLSEGDELFMKLYDVDSGFFNASDLQGKWKIEYVGKPGSFLYEVQNQGQVLALRIAVQVMVN